MLNKSVAFIDTEIDPQSDKILDIGAVRESGALFHKASITQFIAFLNGVQFICGHNILKHDVKYIENALQQAGIRVENYIDTLPLSPLLFPTKPYHALLKDDKLLVEFANNPLNDSIKSKELFHDEVTAFNHTEQTLKDIFYLLLHDQKEFKAFFRFIEYKSEEANLEELIHKRFKNEICSNKDLSQFINKHPIELAYSLSLIDSFINHKKVYSITPPWVLKNYPMVKQIMFYLRSTPCITGCPYCDNALNVHKGLKQLFGFDSFRLFDGQALQERAAKAAMLNKSIIAIFPTGGGKSLTFQLPALMSGQNVRGLTVVISPLQALMKDQVDNLEKLGITDAVTINGLLDPVERANAFERVENGSASILYIAPESLRSKTIERLILGRKIVRFVIDEAHCFSSWGQDFRVDYIYIGDFIKSIQEKQSLQETIPVSCFTATAKQKVIEDIRSYFREKLSLELELFSSTASRTNLHYQVLNTNDNEEKYQIIRDLIEEKNCPTIIYVSRTYTAYKLAERLSQDGFSAKPFHGKMKVPDKTANQDSFIAGESQIMVATSAFGMGVDKKDVGMVIHYDISDSLENYIQEAGRAGRDDSILAECYILYNEEDLSKHFILLNQTKLSIKEIQQVWRAIKALSRFRTTISSSALEIARAAGWDDSVADIETRVRTAIAALEDAGYLVRKQNSHKIYANSILSKSAQKAIDKINASNKFQGKDKERGVAIIRTLFSSKSRKNLNQEEGESRIDYISDRLGIQKEDVIRIVHLLREEGILADTKDLTAFIKRGGAQNQSLGVVKTFNQIETLLLAFFDEEEIRLNLKEVNEKAEEIGYKNIDLKKIRTILNFWEVTSWIKHKPLYNSTNHVAIHPLYSKDLLLSKLEKRQKLALFIAQLLYTKSLQSDSLDSASTEEVLVEFSIHELIECYLNSIDSFGEDTSIKEIEDALLYLSRIGAIVIEGGFLVIYNQLTIERVELDNKIRYKIEDYQKLDQFYKNKIEQIHIVGEYASKMLIDYKEALQFVEDYFHLNYDLFLNRYFKGRRQNEIKRNITPTKFKQLFGELSITQLSVIKDQESKYIAVVAGPGSGKTRILVHKLASLLLMEDVKHEQLLMVTFSRAAATEFKQRLISLIGNAASFIEIKTFHSYCLDLLGRVGSLDKLDNVVGEAVKKIKNGDVESNRITKSVLVIDEAQDMDADEFKLIETLMEYNEEMRVIAVGDDDQNIYEFRGASSKYLEHFIEQNGATKYELIENFRSKSNLVNFTNQFVTQINHRLKQTPIVAHQRDKGLLKVVRYQSNNLITPLVDDILDSRTYGTTCILTKTNDEATQITGLLVKNGIKARLIQTDDSFYLFNLLEIRYFLDLLKGDEDNFTISDQVWEGAKRELKNRFHDSTKVEICNAIIRDFEAINPKRKYKTDLELFIQESKLEDFFIGDEGRIFVSTIHKAKGKEFDNVYLLLDNFNADRDEAKRKLYVAMTRAKQNLIIHLNTNLLDNLSTFSSLRINDKKVYQPPDEIAIALTHRDIWLGYFYTKQTLISELISGESLLVNGDGCLNKEEHPIIKFSKEFISRVERIKAQGFEPKGAKVNYILYWKKEGCEEEIKIVLPELYFHKTLAESRGS